MATISYGGTTWQGVEIVSMNFDRTERVPLDMVSVANATEVRAELTHCDFEDVLSCVFGDNKELSE